MILLDFLDDDKIEYKKGSSRFVCTRDEVNKVLDGINDIYIYDANREKLKGLNIENKAIYDCQTVYILISGILNDFRDRFIVDKNKTDILEYIIRLIESTDDKILRLDCIATYALEIIEIDRLYITLEAKEDIQCALDNMDTTDKYDVIDTEREINSIIEEAENKKDIFNRFRIL